MSSQAFSKIWLIVILVVLVLGGIWGWWYWETLKWAIKEKAKYCEKDDECVLVYTGNDVCAPCDRGGLDFQCLSKEVAQEIKKEREKKYKGVLCEPCPPQPFVFKCYCKENKCYKTKTERN